MKKIIITKKVIIANWKINPLTEKKAKKLFGDTVGGFKNSENIELVICPPDIYLPLFKNHSQKVKLGAQDCFWKKGGAYTGEISPDILKNYGISYVILGHSERRINLKETDIMIAQKIKIAQSAGLKTILCVGENAAQKRQRNTFSVIKKQLTESLSLLGKSKLSGLIIAYEPVWAIGPGDPCPRETALIAMANIKAMLVKLFGENGANIPILYGGSVDATNANNYLENDGFDGLLIGGASLNGKEMTKIFSSIVG
ncbi:MAG: triose-phosphate isomerase [bacterium]